MTRRVGVKKSLVPVSLECRKKKKKKKCARKKRERVRSLKTLKIYRSAAAGSRILGVKGED